MNSKDKGREEPVAGRRRDFLKLASIGAGSAALAAIAGGSEAEAAETATASTGRGYRETDHVKKVYALARF